MLARALTSPAAIGTFVGGEVANAIASHVELRGTVRTFDDATRSVVRRRMDEIVRATAAAYGCEGEVTYLVGYPRVVNTERSVAMARAAALCVVPFERLQTVQRALFCVEECVRVHSPRSSPPSGSLDGG
jgi:metal-dependent amidase/aminoacylase/carboxypeptidase family protein